MAQNNINYGNNPTGPELLDDYLTKEQENILTSNSGIQRPSYAVTGTKWLDVSVSPWILKLYDGNNDVNLGTINPSNHIFTPYGYIDNTTLVHKTGNETIGGVKSFSKSPIVPTVTSNDNSTKVANTAFVQTAVNTRVTSNDVSTAISNTLETLYPVGSIYIGTQNSCPLTTLINGSTWTLVAQNKALWGGDGSNGNTIIDAGLPNITGSFSKQCLMNWGSLYERGALYQGETDNSATPQNAGGTDGGNNFTIAFDASKSNNIYGNSNTVQPPAYRVNIWRRTA